MDPKSKHVALFSQNYLDIGGVETHLLSLVKNAAIGVNFSVIGIYSPSFETQARAAGASPVAWSCASTNRLSAIISLVRLLKSRDIDLLHIHSHRGSDIARIAAYINNTPVISTIHLSLFDHWKDSRTLPQKLKTVAAFAADTILNHLVSRKVIFVSQQAMEKAIRLRLVPKSKAVSIPNGIKLSQFTPGDPAAKSGHTLLFAGRLHRQKGLDILLKALGGISNIPFKLLLAGTGPEEKTLRTLAAASPQGSIGFLGHRTDLPDLLQSADIFILPSRFEAFPYSLIEAMASGLPCIVTDVGENAAIVQNGQCGLVVPPEDADALADAIRTLLEDPAMRQAMGARARQRAADFSEEALLNSLAAIYDELLA
jgi:glycosyltransferase involved in cell wall biosynthesis